MSVTINTRAMKVRETPQDDWEYVMIKTEAEVNAVVQDTEPTGSENVWFDTSDESEVTVPTMTDLNTVEDNLENTLTQLGDDLDTAESDISALEQSLAIQSSEWYHGRAEIVGNSGADEIFFPLDNILLNRVTPSVNKITYFGVNGADSLLQYVTSVSKVRNGLVFRVNTDLTTYLNYSFIMQYTLDQ